MDPLRELDAMRDPVSTSLGMVWVCLCAMLVRVRTQLFGVFVCFVMCFMLSFVVGVAVNVYAEPRQLKRRQRLLLRNWIQCAAYSSLCVCCGLLRAPAWDTTFAILTVSCGYYAHDLYDRVRNTIFNNSELSFLLTFINALLLIGMYIQHVVIRIIIVHVVDAILHLACTVYVDIPV
jgi:hypothetical protein